jgi:uncharacterized membrane protein YbhN (UPF0104 family)
VLTAWSAAHRFARRHRVAVTIAGSVIAVAALAFVLAGRRHDFATALSRVSLSVFVLAVVLQIVALLARTEAWHLTIGRAGGTVPRRVLYRASSMGYVASLFNSQVGVAARIAACGALRPPTAHASPRSSPRSSRSSRSRPRSPR